MKYKCLGLLLIASLVVFSCTKDEVLNSEADILSITVPAEILKVAPVVENNRIAVRVKFDTDLTQQSPLFDLSQGATINPKSGTTLDFSQPQLYTVTSEDGNYSKVYTVSYIKTEIELKYNFNNYRLDESGKYHVFYEKSSNGDNIMDWASGNSAFVLLAGSAPAEQYPTTYATVSQDNYAAKLTTHSTGPFGAMFGMPLAAGNLFMGNFDSEAALANPLEAVKMGVPFEHVPKTLKGTFKYKEGDVFIGEANAQGEKRDYWDIYAIFYDNNGGELMLNGSNKFTHENLVSIARIEKEEAVESESWKEFEVSFVMEAGKSIDAQKLANGGYNISIVMTSSINGDFFRGAVNSTLLVDKLEIICYD